MGLKGFDDGRTALTIGAIMLLVFALSNSAIEALHYEVHWTLELVLELVRDLGIAFIVGGIVSLGIERLSRKRFLDEIAAEIHKIERSAINAAYLKDFPEKYTEFLEGMLASSDLFRHNTSITIDLIEPAEPIFDKQNSPMLYVEITSSSTIQNISKSPALITPPLFQDCDWDKKPPKLLAWKAGDKELNADEIVEAEASAVQSTFQHHYTFPKTFSLEPGATLHVHSKVRTRKYQRDVTTWCGLLPSDQLRFTIAHPAGYRVFAQAKTPARDGNLPLETDGRRLDLEIFSALLPYTTVEYGWHKSNSDDEFSHGDTLGAGLQLAETDTK